MTGRSLRCAIYTRKSSDEGLDQSFNSLDAQREAGEAYVKSQAHEGWKVIAACYDDGGFSGGSMERPGLRRLLADVDAGQIDVVVVYKIDRLTRSLPDFARIVERFDAREVSFVSVTQSFNTTSSMGRLTLNVLLSFAQFEREVTGERIRDKIAASKAKGMWMGGNPPIGYDLPASGTRILQANEAEAEVVRHIFKRYLELGSVHALQRELAERGIVSKQRVTAKGKTVGGLPFSRGALFHLLRSQIYRGRIPHKKLVHEGCHAAIVSQELFDQAQEQLDLHARRHKASGEARTARAPLTGKIFDEGGELMSPSFSRGKGGRIYRYYVSSSLQQGASEGVEERVRRVAAASLEQVLLQLLRSWLPAARAQLDQIAALRLQAQSILIDMPANLAADIAAKLKADQRLVFTSSQICRIELPLAMPLRGGKRLVIAGAVDTKPDPALIAALRKAHRMTTLRSGLPRIETAPASRYDRDLLRLAFLAPDLQRDILAGRQPASLSLERLRHIDIPLSWDRQREVLGWPAAA